MEKFAVDLDKVLDEFELNEDEAYVNDNLKNCPVGRYNDIISTTKYNQYNALPPSINVKNNKSSYPCIDDTVPSLVNQHIENINLDDADFAPSTKTTSTIYQRENHPQSNGDGPDDWKKFVNVSNENNSVPAFISKEVTNHSKSDTQQRELEPDVVQVSVPSVEGHSDNESSNRISDAVQQTLPDVMVFSSNVLVDEPNIKEDSLSTQNELLKNNFVDEDSPLTTTEKLEKETSVSNEMNAESTEECDIVAVEDEASDLDVQKNLIEGFTEANDLDEHKAGPAEEEDKNEQQVISFKSGDVSESELSDYLAELEQLENINATEGAMTVKSDLNEVSTTTKIPDQEESRLKEPVVESNSKSLPENKYSETEGAMKRQIDQIDGCINNTGARPKKSLIYNEKLNQRLEEISSVESLDRLNTVGESKIENLFHIESVSSAPSNCAEEQTERLNNYAESHEVQISNPNMNYEDAKVNSIEDYHQNIQSQDNNSVIRRQRPTSLNLPPRLNLGLPKVENVEPSLSKSPSSVTPDCPDFNLQSNSQSYKQQTSQLMQNNVNQLVIQRPSSLQVGAPLNTLMNTLVQPPGHTPGDVLGIPDLCQHLEASSTVPDESTTQDVAPPSPSISSQSGCSISTSPVTAAPPKSWPVSSAGESSPVTSTSTEDQQLGRVAPFWVPDSCSPSCMLCDAKFNMIKRRHHCRACGKVLCSQCCNLKAKIQYMDYKDARVCQPCSDILSRVNAQKIGSTVDSNNLSAVSDSNINSVEGSSLSSGTPSPSLLRGRSPNPNNPDEYCSTIPPLQQAQAALQKPPPTVMVPVGVLKREGCKGKGEPKQVIFSDGIRPGGDLTELDLAPEPFIPPRKHTRTQKKLTPGPASQSNHGEHVNAKALIAQESVDSTENAVSQGDSGLNNLEIDDLTDTAQLLETAKDDTIDPVSFSINKNLSVLMKIVNLDCCVNKICWCFTTKGMCTIGQDEIVIVLECLPDETTPPTDIFRHLSFLYDEASKGNVVSDMGHSLVTQTFLGDKDHGGFLYIKPTFQCLNKLVLPPAPYLCGILLEKWEAPWAKVFPMRLMLRLGAEFRYYPCPLISVRSRKPVFCEIGHTIMNVLADFRNYQYILPAVRGMVTVMEDKKTYINFPRNRYDEVMKALNNSNDHVLALSSNFSMEADSHLVCVQNDDGNYQTQAINIQNKARRVTGASFVVFNGALKTSSGLSAKSSIIEDGLMVQISADTMLALRQSLRDMQDFTIGCGPMNITEPDEIVLVKWVEDDKNVNVGVRSVVDGMEFNGIQSIRIHSGTDYMGDSKLIRWTEVFLIKTEEDGNSMRMDPINISRLSETLAQACCIALTPHLDQLKEASINKIGLRVTINSEKVEYEVGANEERLPDFYMNDLDSELVPVIHRAASNNHEGLVVLELVFYILEY